VDRGSRAQNAILAAFGAAALTIVLLGWALFDVTGKASQSQAMVQHTERVLGTIAALRESMALAESGQRGFLLTGDDQYRRSRDMALAQVERYRAEVFRLVADNPRQQDRTQRLLKLLDERIAIMRKTERIRSDQGVAAAKDFFTTGLPEQANARIRHLVSELAQEETRLLLQRQARERQGHATTRRILALAGLAFIALLVPVLLGFVRQSRARQRAEARLRDIADSLPGAVYLYRLTPQGVGTYEFLSSNAERVRGIDREQVLRDASAAREGIIEEDRERFSAAVARSAEELSDLDVDFRIRKPDGAIRWLRSSAIPFRQPDGDVVWNGYWSDITEIKQAELALRDAMRRLEDAQSVAGLGDWTCDLATGALTWSPQIYELLERDPALGPPSLEEGVAIFDGGADATAAAFARARETGEPQDYEMTARLPSGGVVALHVIAVPDRDDTGAIVGMRGTIQDVTSRKALEERLSSAKEAADSANRAKSVFLATMSHEIRTPMNGILGILELISLTPLNPELRTALEVVRESGKSLQRIIDDILDFSKVEAGKLEIRPEPTCIEDVVAGVHRIYSGSASSLGLELRHGVDPGISPAVMVDGLRLRQVLSNFVSNAIKFTPKGHVEIRVQLVERDGDQERLRFIVEDTGIGISPEAQQRLFQPFEQAEANIATRFGGTGLGLAISRRLAELMGGEVSMSSEPGKGTTMLLELPVVVTDPEYLVRATDTELVAALQPATNAAVPTVAQAVAEGTLVLVVDDHPTNRMVMRSQLNTLGYAAETTENGVEALEQWNSGRFALVLTDCNMPEMSGYELSRRIRETEAIRGKGRTPIIACSANALGGVLQNCLDAGMDDYIPKPTGLMALAEKMKHWLPLPAHRAGGASVPPGPGEVEGAGDRRGGLLDRRALHAVSKGEPVATRRILQHFRRVNEADVELLMHAVEHGDLPSITHSAHRIKGACGFIGATDLASVCSMVEQAGRAGDGTAIDELMEGFRSELERLNAYLDAD
jgi:PAS domain S-box-containing protein